MLKGMLVPLDGTRFDRCGAFASSSASGIFGPGGAVETTAVSAQHRVSGTESLRRSERSFVDPRCRGLPQSLGRFRRCPRRCCLRTRDTVTWAARIFLRPCQFPLDGLRPTRCPKRASLSDDTLRGASETRGNAFRSHDDAKTLTPSKPAVIANEDHENPYATQRACNRCRTYRTKSCSNGSMLWSALNAA
jgi:hypothetical protein